MVNKYRDWNPVKSHGCSGSQWCSIGIWGHHEAMFQLPLHSSPPIVFLSLLLSLLPLPLLPKLRAQTQPPGGNSELHPISKASTYLPSTQGFNKKFTFVLLSTMGKNAGAPKLAKKVTVSMTTAHLSIIWPLGSPGATARQHQRPMRSLFPSLACIRVMPQPTGFWLMKCGQWYSHLKACP